MVDFLAKKIGSSLAKIKNTKKFSEKIIAETLREIKFALLESDVNLKIVRDFLNKIKIDIEKANVIKKIKPQQQIIAIIQKEIIKILGEKQHNINISKKPTFIMIVGLQGSGKTTSCAKIANYFATKKNKKIMVVGCDVNRPAAMEQLEKLVADIKNITCFYEKNTTSKIIVKKAIEKCHREKFEVVIFDTAGRNFVNKDDIDEIEILKKIIAPREIIFIVDALVGQSIYEIIQKFNHTLKLTGTFLSKFDSEAKSGSAFTIVNLCHLPIYFVGVGEKITDIELYHPDRLANRILGKGDILTLVEKAKEQIDEKSSQKMINRMLSGNFTLDDLIKQMKQVKRIGSVKSILKLFPGGNKIDNSKIDKATDKLKLIQILYDSMTNIERKKIELLKQPNRKNRIIKGSGSTEFNYNQMLKQLNDMKKNFQKLQNMLKQN